MWRPRRNTVLPVVLVSLMLTSVLTANAKTIEITLFGMPHANNPEWNEAGVEMWKAANPQYKDVKVDIVSDREPKLVTMTVAGTPPDVLHFSSSDIPSLVYNEFLRDLTPIIQKDTSLNLRSYIPSTIETQRYKNGLYGLPRAWSGVGTMYNADLLAVRGIAVPPSTWTWNDLLALARKATFDSNGDGHNDHFGFADTWTHHHRWPVWVWGTGGELYNEDLTVATLNTEAAVRGMEFMTDLYVTHNVAPKMISNKLAEPGLTTTQSGHSIYGDLFNRGLIAFFNTTRFSRPTSDLFQYGVLQLPKGPAGRTSVMVSDFYGLSPHSKNPDIAWDLIKALTSPAGYEVARDPSKMYYWALSPHIRQARDTLINAPDLQAQNWVIVADDARRPTASHPAAGRYDINFNAVASGQMSMRQAIDVAVERQNAKLKEMWAHKPW